MIYINKSKLTGKMHNMELNITEKEFKVCFTKWIRGTLIQDAFPMLNPEEREFVMNGITPQEWDEIFGKEKV